MKIKLTYLLIALTFATGCSREEPGDTTELIPVVINVAPIVTSSVAETETKAPLNYWYNTDVNMAIGQTSSKTDQPNFRTTPLSAIVHNNITSFSPKLFYPTNGNYIHLRGYYPSLPGVRTITDNKVTYTITGQEDIMISNIVKGSASNPIADQGDEGIVTYRHLLTQMSFTLRNDGTFPSSVKVTEIRINNLSLQATLNLTDGSLAFDNTSNSTLTAYSNSAGIEVLTTASVPLGHTMFQAGELSTVDVVLSTGDIVSVSDLKTINAADGTIGYRAGYAYRVELLFKGVGVVSSIVPVSWNKTGVTNPQMPGNLW